MTKIFDSELIEEAAKVCSSTWEEIYSRDYPDDPHESWEYYSENRKEKYREIVRAVLEAVCEPE